MYEYEVEEVHVVDGDTVYARLSLGFGISFNAKLRLAGINTPEMHTPTMKEGRQAREHLVKLLDDAESLRVKTFKDKTGKYGRYIATIYGTFVEQDNDGDIVNVVEVNINQQMVEDGHAEVYGG